MIQFAISKEEQYFHIKISTETWYSADARTGNQIDHILISHRFRSVRITAVNSRKCSLQNLVQYNFGKN